MQFAHCSQNQSLYGLNTNKLGSKPIKEELTAKLEQAAVDIQLEIGEENWKTF